MPAFRSWLHRVAFALAALALAPSALAQADAKGSKDHPLLTRYPDSRIEEYRRQHDAVELVVGLEAGQPKRHSVEGETTVIRYFHNRADRQPSALQVIRNYQNAVKGIGGAVVYERLPRDTDGGETTLRVATGGKDVWVRVLPDIFGAPTQSYQLTVVEVAAMAQVVTASRLLDELGRQGFVALYIPFDTGKADLKPEGRAAVAEIVKALQGSPALRLAIEGHTDNVGKAAANKALSERRARSVMEAVVAGGVDAKRLSAAGFGQERPVADNRSEEGRAKNRRVELVRK